jgi:hypothetical protein
MPDRTCRRGAGFICIERSTSTGRSSTCWWPRNGPVGHRPVRHPRPSNTCCAHLPTTDRSRSGGDFKARLRPMRKPHAVRSARNITAGHAFAQNLVSAVPGQMADQKGACELLARMRTHLDSTRSLGPTRRVMGVVEPTCNTVGISTRSRAGQDGCSVVSLELVVALLNRVGPSVLGRHSPGAAVSSV